MGLQIVVESLSRSSWNHCPDPRGIAVQLRVEYAARENARRPLGLFRRAASALAHCRRGAAILKDRWESPVPAQGH